MPPTFFNSSVEYIRSVLTAAERFLTVAEQHPGISSDVFSASLIEDMRPLSFHFGRTELCAYWVVAKTQGLTFEPAKLPQEEITSFALAHERIAKALEQLNKLEADVVNGNADILVKFPASDDKLVDTPLWKYFTFSLLPNATFHLDMAYAILRKEGVPLGKADHLNAFQGSIGE